MLSDRINVVSDRKDCISFFPDDTPYSWYLEAPTDMATPSYCIQGFNSDTVMLLGEDATVDSEYSLLSVSFSVGLVDQLSASLSDFYDASQCTQEPSYYSVLVQCELVPMN